MTSSQHQPSNKQTDHLVTHYQKIGSPAILAAVRNMSARKAPQMGQAQYSKKALAFMLSRNG